MDLIYFLIPYGALAHGLLFSSYYKKITNSHREKIIYFMAHLLIAFAFILRIKEKNRGDLYIPIIGTIGHSSLLLFFILSTFIFQTKYRVSFTGENLILNLLCIIGQIGMIIMYWIDYEKRNDPDLYSEYLEIIQIFKLVTFALLSYFYFRVAFKSDNKFTNIFFGLFMVCILYIMFIYKTFHGLTL